MGCRGEQPLHHLSAILADYRQGHDRTREKLSRERDGLATMPTVLMVAEKPSLAKSIAQILSGGQYHSRPGVW